MEIISENLCESKNMDEFLNSDSKFFPQCSTPQNAKDSNFKNAHSFYPENTKKSHNKSDLKSDGEIQTSNGFSFNFHDTVPVNNCSSIILHKQDSMDSVLDELAVSLKEDSIDSEESNNVSDLILDEASDEDYEDLQYDYLDFISPELQEGYRIVQELMHTRHSNFNWPFIEKVNSENEGLWDYDEVVTQPMWLKKVCEKIQQNEYKTITTLMKDLRLILENCYRYNGPNHSITKKALKLEELLEHKISKLSLNLIESCSLEATSGQPKENIDMILAKKRSKYKSFFSYILHRVRHERSNRIKEYKKKLQEEKRLEREEKEHAVIEWENNTLISNSKYVHQLLTMWELPQLGHFIYLMSHVLNLPEISQYEVERMLLMPQASSFLSSLMTSLLSPPNFRKEITSRPSMPYNIWTQKLAFKVKEWYRVFIKEGTSSQRAFEILGIEPDFWNIVGKHNPFEQYLFHEMLFIQRIWLIKSLCDYLLQRQKSLQEVICEHPIVLLREQLLGNDASGFSYHYFPIFLSSCLRIYRQSPWIPPSLQITNSIGESKFQPKTIKIFIDTRKRRVVKKNKKVIHEESLCQTRQRPANLRQHVTPVNKHDQYLDLSDSDNDFNYQCSNEIEHKSLTLRLPVWFEEKRKNLSSRIDFLKTSQVKRKRGRPPRHLKDAVHYLPSNSCKEQSYNEFVSKDNNVSNILNHTAVSLPKKRGRPRKISLVNSNLISYEDQHETKCNMFQEVQHLSPLINSPFLLSGEEPDVVKNILDEILNKVSMQIDDNLLQKINCDKFSENSAFDTNGFQLIVDNVESLRNLIVELENQSQSRENVRGNAKLEREHRKLIKNLKQLLEELEPFEARLLTATRRIRNKLKKEWDTWLDKDPNMPEAGEEVWLNDTDVDLEPETAPVHENEEDEFIASSGNESNLLEEGTLLSRRKYHRRRVKRKKVLIESDDDDPNVKGDNDPSETWEVEVSSRGRTRKVRKLMEWGSEDEQSDCVETMPSRNKKSRTMSTTSVDVKNSLEKAEMNLNKQRLLTYTYRNRGQGSFLAKYQTQQLQNNSPSSQERIQLVLSEPSKIMKAQATNCIVNPTVTQNIISNDALTSAIKDVLKQIPSGQRGSQPIILMPTVDNTGKTVLMRVLGSQANQVLQAINKTANPLQNKVLETRTSSLESPSKSNLRSQLASVMNVNKIETPRVTQVVQNPSLITNTAHVQIVVSENQVPQLIPNIISTGIMLPTPPINSTVNDLSASVNSPVITSQANISQGSTITNNVDILKAAIDCAEISSSEDLKQSTNLNKILSVSGMQEIKTINPAPITLNTTAASCVSHNNIPHNNIVIHAPSASQGFVDTALFINNQTLTVPPLPIQSVQIPGKLVMIKTSNGLQKLGVLRQDNSVVLLSQSDIERLGLIGQTIKVPLHPKS